MATGVYTVVSGHHEFTLSISTGASKSDRYEVDLRPGETRTFRTVGLSLKEWNRLPLALFSPDHYAPRPWIRLREVPD